MVRLLAVLAFSIVTVSDVAFPAIQASPDTQAEIGVDELFAQARRLAFLGNREEARQLCASILTRSPSYHDARILLGRLYAWDHQYDKAREELKRVLDASPDLVDARKALIDVELWSDNPQTARQLADDGLRSNPNDEELLLKRARALKGLGDAKGAAVTAKQILRVNPDHRDARVLLADMEELQQVYNLKLEYTHDRFDQTFDPWHLVAVSFSRRQSFGTVIGRVNYARRFGEWATQFEVDAYPKFGSGVYAYLNAGYSKYSIFPKVRVGAELYASPAKGFEASFGMRHLQFASNVNIYTGSLGVYAGNYWISLRPFITPGSAGTSFSGSVTVRRYLRDPYGYIGVQFGAGSAPDERYTTWEFFSLKSQRTELEIKKRIAPGLGFLASFGFVNQQINPGDYRKQYTFSTGLEKRF